MELSGRVFIDFKTPDVWRLYSTALRASADSRVHIDMTWEEFLVDDIPDGEVPPAVRLLAACAVVRNEHPEQHQRFVQAMMTLIYQEKDDPKRDTTLLVAARVADIDGLELVARALDPGLELLTAHSDEVRGLGVTAVPSILDTGPALRIKMSGAAAYGDAVGRMQMIGHMLADDGVWELAKP